MRGGWPHAPLVQAGSSGIMTGAQKPGLKGQTPLRAALNG